ncbi:MAG: ribonuclease H-like domain-containing protein [Candidatus Colwellbacteria bacterium]|nr:ribonuclease H-like domain-containing protein [Candidatus Colwellbacteria bacterium]
MKDKLVIDIETSNTFDDVGGKHNLEKLSVSLVGVYSYNSDRFFAIREGNIESLADQFKNAGLIIGFSSNRFDLPVLKKHFNFDVMSLPSFDILEEIERTTGKRVSLDILARTNLGFGKTGHGLDAIKYYAMGDWEALEKYCLQDVKVTKDLYDLAERQGYLIVPERWGGNLKKVEFEFPDLSAIAPAEIKNGTLF